jgi:N-acetylmuramoyl-L-alanine amidase
VIGALSLSSAAIYGATIISTSIFILPGSEYTHIMIETDQATMHSMLVLKNPNRIVLDLRNSPINNQLMELASKKFSDDSYVKQVRVAKFQAGITRIVFDLNAEVKPKLNVYKPQGKYQHRLMLDLYPLEIVQKTDQDRHVSPSIHSISNMDSIDTNASSTKSSGAKIILDPSSDDDEISTDEYE